MGTPFTSARDVALREPPGFLILVAVVEGAQPGHIGSDQFSRPDGEQ
ncbi:hypothetical protein [Streptomyces sp. KR55]